MEKLPSIVILICKKWKKSEQIYCDWIMRYILWLPESTVCPKRSLPLLMYVIKRAPGVRICNEDFTPNRKNSSCQEMIGHILR